MVGLYRNKDKFKELQKNIPETGDTLVGQEGEKIYVNVEIHPTKHEVVSMYVNARINDDCTGWYLSNNEHGLKVLIHPDDHDKVKERCNNELTNMFVTEVSVVCQGAKKTSLIVEDISDET